MSTMNQLEFLSAAELVALTDKQHADAQIAWLEARSIPHFVSGKGKPKVLRCMVLAQVGQETTSEPVVLP